MYPTTGNEKFWDLMQLILEVLRQTECFRCAILTCHTCCLVWSYGWLCVPTRHSILWWRRTAWGRQSPSQRPGRSCSSSPSNHGHPPERGNRDRSNGGGVVVVVVHYNDVIMGMIASQITSLTIVYSTVYSDAYQRKHQSSASLAFVWGIHRRPVNYPHKWPVTRKMLPLDDVIM